MRARWSTDSTGPMGPRSILNASAIYQVNGCFGALSTRRPSGKVPKRESPPALSSFSA